MNTFPTVFDNPAVTITAIIATGTLIAYKIHIDAKYNRETDISFDENGHFHLVSRPVTTDNFSLCPA